MALEISHALGARIDSLVPTLFPAARREGRYWCIGDLTGTPGKSLKIEIGGPRAGRWRDWSQDIAGDGIDLIAFAKCGGDLGRAFAWARDWLGLPREEYSSRQHLANDRQETREDVKAAKPSETLGTARRVWGEGQRAAGSPAETYLASRGLSLPALAPIKFHPACPRGADRLPAMLALMTDPERNTPCGVHRTFLLPDGSGKAPVEPAKSMLGNAGVIRLMPDEEITSGLGIAEGIENALTIMQHAGWPNIWATGTASGIAKFPVLAGIECLTIFADHDIAGTRAAQECASRWTLAGREVRIIVPRQHADWNDTLKAVA